MQIDTKKILKILPGLETYKDPSKKAAEKYMKDIDPIKFSNSLILLLIYLFCVISNFVVLSVRQDASVVYQLNR